MRNITIKMKNITFFAILLFALNAMAQNAPSADSARFSKHFLEVKFIYGPAVEEDVHETQFSLDIGIGVQYSHLSDRWGWYGGLAYIDGKVIDYTGLTGGAVYRILNASHKVDLQVYSGLSYGIKMNNHFTIYPGLDAGFRIAPGAKAGRRKFAWTSFSFGRTHFYNKPVYTLGFSIGLTVIPVASILYLNSIF